MSAGRPGTLPELLGRAVGAFGERDALVTAEDRLSYRELSDLVDRHAAGLVGLGVGKGTRVGLLMESSVDWVSLAFAATGLGALLVPVSTFTDAAGLAHQLRHADVAVLLASAGFLGHDYLGALGEVAPELEDGPPGALRCARLPALRRVVVRGAAALPAGCDGWEELERAAETVPVGLVRSLRAEVDPEDDCYLLYTSGTTAEPKGVLHRHRSVAGTGFIVGERQRLGPGDVAWSHFPLFFAAGCVNVMLGSLSHGTTLLLQPVFEPATAIELIDREGVTVWHLWPHVFKALTEHPDWGRRDHSRLHKGTGPYDLVLKVSSPDGAGGVNMYGMTETATAFTCTWADDSPEIRSSTHGEPLPGNEVRIVDPSTGAPLPTGAEGEIRVRGDGVMRRYYKVDPSRTFDADGFLPTGDVGFLGEDGRLRFVRRSKDVIKSAGVNVSPAEVEARLGRLEGVGAAYVFGLPSRERGEVVGAAIVLRPGHDLDEADLLARCANLPPYQRPVAVLVVDAAEVPMTGTGKVQKRLLRERLLARRAPPGGTY